MLSATPPLIWWPALVYWTASETSTALVSKVAGKSGEVPRATASEARTVPANPLCFHSRRAALKPARNSLARSDPEVVTVAAALMSRALRLVAAPQKRSSPSWGASSVHESYPSRRRSDELLAICQSSRPSPLPPFQRRTTDEVYGASPVWKLSVPIRGRVSRSETAAPA